MGEPLYQIMGRHRAEPLPERKPSWLKVKAPGGPNYLRLKQLMRELDLHTVCEEAHCPNVGECWEHGTATFMILGDVCTRNCAYCAVAHGRPPKYDSTEPERVARGGRRDEAAARRHHVGRPRRPARLRRLGIFAETIRQIHERAARDARSRCSCPISRATRTSIRAVLEARARDLQPQHRDGAAAVQEVPPRRPLRARDGDLPHRRSASRPHIPTKTGIILGMGETIEEVVAVMRICARSTSTSSRSASTCARPTITSRSTATSRPTSSARFDEIGMAMGFRHVESGPLVRSSYHAWEQVQAAGVTA